MKFNKVKIFDGTMQEQIKKKPTVTGNLLNIAFTKSKALCNKDLLTGIANSQVAPAIFQLMEKTYQIEQYLSMALATVKRVLDDTQYKNEALLFINGSSEVFADDNYTQCAPGSLKYRYLRASRLAECLSMGMDLQEAMRFIENNEKWPGLYVLAILTILEEHKCKSDCATPILFEKGITQFGFTIINIERLENSILKRMKLTVKVPDDMQDKSIRSIARTFWQTYYTQGGDAVTIYVYRQNQEIKGYNWHFMYEFSPYGYRDTPGPGFNFTLDYLNTLS